MNPRLLVTAALLIPLPIAALLRSGVFAPLAIPEYSPRRALYLAHPGLMWTSVCTDIVLALSYLFFIAGLLWLVRRLKAFPRLRGNLWILSALNIFFIARCVTTVLNVIRLWLPLYNFSIVLNAVCAATSVPAAIAFLWGAPALAANIGHFFHLLASEKHQADDLRKSQEFLDRTSRLAGAGGWELDLRTRRVTWSRETYRIHGALPGYEPVLSEVLAKYKPEARVSLDAAISKASSEGGGWDIETPVTTFDGREIWIRTVGEAEMVNSKPRRLVGAVQDITSIVAARNALREANERIEIATDSGGIGIFSWDLASGSCTCDPWMYRLHDLEQPGETTPLEFWTQHMHPDDRMLVLNALHKAVEGPDPYNTEYRVVWNDRSVHYLRATGKVTRDASGKAISMIGANWDNTESRRLTAQLAEQHELLHITLQSIGDGVITTDAERNVLWLNPAAERMTGWENVDAIGQPVGVIFRTLNEDTRETTENPLAHHIAVGRAVGIAQHTLLVSRDGTEFGIENSVAPIHNTFGDLIGNVLVFRDVTEQRRLAAETDRNAQLKIQLKLKDEFLSHVSHELRSPLSSISSFTSIIADNLAGETTPEQNDYLHIILKNVTQLQSMIEDLLTVTQSREGKLPIDPRSVSIPEAITDSLHTVQSAASAKHIDLSASVADQLPAAYADPTRLQQILIILLDNAIKFTPPHGTIRVSVSSIHHGLLLFQVSDTGCGIPPEKRSLVFENLYQVRGPGQPDTSQAGRTGLGLGLHIARNLVTRQGGKIWVTEGPVTGSIFHFTLPAFVEGSNTEQDFPPAAQAA